MSTTNDSNSEMGGLTLNRRGAGRGRGPGRGRGGRGGAVPSNHATARGCGGRSGLNPRAGGRGGRGRGGLKQPQKDCPSEQKNDKAATPPLPKADLNEISLHPQQEVIDPKKWGTSVSKAFLRQELLKPDSEYWKMKPKDAYESRTDLFSPFNYTNFVTNFRNLKGSIKAEVDAISFDDEAVKKEQAAFPLSEMDSRGNKRFHNHPARQLLVEDIKNGAGKTYFNRPRDLRNTRSEYLEFKPEYFRKHLIYNNRSIFNNYRLNTPSSCVIIL